MPDDITLSVNGRTVRVPADTTVATAVILAGQSAFRKSVNGEPRGPLCGMGICFECRVTIDGRPHRRSCQTLCQPHMEVQADAS